MKIRKDTNWKIPCLRWLKRIEEEVNSATRINIIGQELNKIANSNPDLSKDSELWEWMHTSFVCHIVIRLTKIMEKEGKKRDGTKFEDDITFEEFLNTLLKNSSYIMTKETYVERFGTDTNLKKERENKYIELTGGEESQIYIKKDIESLKAEREKYTEFRNYLITHMKRKKENIRKPTFEEVDKTINILQGLVIKYNHLIEGRSTINFNIKPRYGNVFDIPWKSKNHKPKLNLKFVSICICIFIILFAK